MKKESVKIKGPFYKRRAARREKKKRQQKYAVLISIVFLVFIGVVVTIGAVKENKNKPVSSETSSYTSTTIYDQETFSKNTTAVPETAEKNTTTELAEPTEPTPAYTIATAPLFDITEIAAYTGSPYVEVNGNVPFFTETDYTTESYEYYSPLDQLQRCGYAVACVGTDIMPTEPRGEIGSIKPSGWHTVRYDDLIEDRYLYNRCHLIAYELTGENDNVCNLITGTRYMNMLGMLPFENRVCDYVTATDNHVLYRSTPIFEGDNLVASGVLLEAYSIEDNGKGVSFNVFTYNVQPDIEIDYATGDSIREEITTEPTTEITRDVPVVPASEEPASEEKEVTYILNKNTRKFHRPFCSSVLDMKESNKVNSYETRDEVIARGYVPCQRCNP